jgi:L-cysteine desulfidase
VVEGVLSVSITCVSGEKTKSNLGVSSLGTVVESSQFINEVRLKRIKPILNLESLLDSLSLSVKEVLNISHKVGALWSIMSYEPTFCTNFMDMFVSALDPNSISIIKSEHETCHKWEPRVYTDSNTHKTYISGC